MLERFLYSPWNQYWVMQLLFWVGLCCISFFTLTLWYNQVTYAYISHTLLQCVFGFMLSIPLHPIYSHIWEYRPLVRFSLVIAVVAAVALVWTVLRIESFLFLTEEVDVWADFGGWYFGAFFVFLCWTTIDHGIRYYQLLQSEHKLVLEVEAAARDEQVKRILAETEAREAQLKMLRYQLNPHFLFNTLNAINSLIQVKEGGKAQQMIVQLSQFLRYSLDNNPDAKIPLEREIDALMLYLEIEKTRFGDRLVLDFEINENAKDVLIPSLLLQPLIENSMKYAISKNEEGGTIRVSAHRVATELTLELSDSGSCEKINRNKLRRSNGRGIGLRNTADRLKNLYGEEYEFTLNVNSSGGLRTIIRIPCEFEEQESAPLN